MDDRSLTAKPCPEDTLATDFSEVDVVCFDVFDTLLVRPFEQPGSVFELLGERARELSRGAIVDFRSDREAAKGWALARRGADRHHGGDERGEEIPLEERYRALALARHLTEDAARSLLEAELALEAQFVRPNLPVAPLFRRALSEGKLVCLLSDTYLPREFVERLLRDAGYAGWHRLYVSSAVGALKSSGRLFGHLLGDLAVAPERVLHIGDDAASDVRQAGLRGLRTLHLPAPSETFVRHARGARHFRYEHALTESLVRGLEARRFAQNHRAGDPESFVGPTPEALGYGVFGPILLGFVSWLVQTLRAAEVDSVFFLARDGRVMKAAYDALREALPTLPPATYLYASRRATAVAALERTEDVIAQLDGPYSPMPLGALLHHRLGLDWDAIAALDTTPYGFASPAVVVHPERDRVLLERLVRGVAPRVLAAAEAERGALLGYFADSGLCTARRPALVDIGHAGSLQRAIGKLLGRGDLIGRYFATTAPIPWARPGEVSSFIGGDARDPDTAEAYRTRLAMFELLFLSDEDSFVRVERVNDGWRPHTLETSGDEPRRVFVRELHRGATEFVRDVVQVLGDQVLQLRLPAREAVAPYLALLAAPSAADASSFSGVLLENAYAGRPSLPVLGGSPHGGVGLWPEGTRASIGPAPPGRQLVERFARSLDGLGFRPSRKVRKLLRDPRAFLRDSRFAWLRRLGKAPRGDDS